MKTAVAINGACGRMGQRLIALGHSWPGLYISAALEWAGHPMLGRDAGEVAGVGAIGVVVSRELPVEPRTEVVIDFSSPEGTMAILPVCVARRIPLVVATTGHTPEQLRELRTAAHETAILHSPNMSLVVNVLFRLTELAGQMLAGKGYDVEIVEFHHRFKKDSPSGTALHFAKILQSVMGQTELRHGREGLVGERPPSEIGLHAIRGGDNVGEHTILFSTLGESMELVHRGHSRDAYARGALQAAAWLAGKPAGHYSMRDVLGLG